ncbi:hypothetical protein EOS_03625 [Caballeronia mineralivorans PML1(12)]|uniref:Zinc finger/thioredoxin putative domain-containing protein n=1 Tax=Caballeronia mineralivorans PML1(12) TaxID=908627 RepID=A0A0J1D4F0_9BURK|nr:zinc-ribbon and DUF3426 domain-containing protein [Caballeronia mineralivorans]KLU27574.1 hypothetical protein EOS_03625 [Caballeronia mineralivorans PML1(12)]
MALATRCPHCETVFRLDPHLLAPHDGRVRCGHCQEIFDAAHYQFDRDETVMAALAATAPNYGADPASPRSEKSSAEVSGGKRDAPGIPLHPFVSNTALAPQAEANQTPAAREEPLAGVAAAKAVSRTRAQSDFPGEGHAGSPWQAVNRAEAEAPTDTARAKADAPARTEPRADPFVARTDGGDPLKESRTDPFVRRTETEALNESRTEPFVGRSEPRVEPETPAPRHTTDTNARTEPSPLGAAPAAPWAADPEPRFGSAPTSSTPSSEPFPVIRETRAPVRSAIVWKILGSLIALVLFVALIAQVAWWQRETVMVYWPASQPLFAQACEQIGCVVAPPRDIDGLQIENSGLRQVDGSHKLELKLSLRNRFDVAIAYPALELTLLDDKNNVAIRRVLWPQDYARPGTAIGAGLAARSTQPVIVRLDTGDAVAANYRVQIFYP